MKLLNIIIIIIVIVILYYKEYIIFASHINKYYNDSSIFLKKINEYNRFIISFEGIFIIPSNPVILKLYHLVYNDFKPILIEPIERYVTFTRLKISNADRINCDWCSMANGLIYLIKKSINFYLKNNPDKLRNINLFNVKMLNIYISNLVYYLERIQINKK